MKLYRQGTNDLRIHLTKEDLEAFSITVEDFDYDSTRGKRVIWALFDKAREETGFDAAGEKVYIQLYPMEKGGCELFVTKIEKEEERKECFLFSTFDSFYTALTLSSSSPKDMTVFRTRDRERFYTLIPSEKVPAVFYEFGEKVKAPSTVFLHSRCRRVHWEERRAYDDKRT